MPLAAGSERLLGRPLDSGVAPGACHFAELELGNGIAQDWAPAWRLQEVQKAPCGTGCTPGSSV